MLERADQRFTLTRSSRITRKWCWQYQTSLFAKIFTRKVFKSLRRFGDAERLGLHVLEDNRLDSEDLAGKVD